MKTQYREMFDEVHASQRLKEEVMNMTRQEKTRVVRKISVSFVVAAALAVILAGTALAAAIGVPQTLQEWFGQQWTEAGGGEEMPKEQAAVIDSLVQPVGVTAISNGISITLDSVTAGEKSLWMLLKIEGTGQKKQTLWNFSTKLEGGPMEKKQATIVNGQEAYPDSRSWQTAGFTEDEAQMQILIYDAPKGVNFLEGGDLTLTLGKMWTHSFKDDEEDTELPGRWALAFTLEPVEELEFLTAKDTQIPAQEIQWVDGQDQPNMVDKTVTLKNIRVTSLGISYEMKKEETLYDMEAPSVRLKGGMEITMFSGSGSEGNKQYSWSVPVDLSKVEAVLFGEVVIPLEKPKK